MKCPVCDVALQMSERQGIEIDYCPQCRGVWLDRGELDKIIERTGGYGPGRGGHDEAPPRDRHHGERHDEHRSYEHGHGDHKHKKKKSPASFLGDIFDM